MKGNSNMTLRSAAWRKLVAAFVAVATLLAMVIVSGVASRDAWADTAEDTANEHSLNDYIQSMTLKKASKGSDDWKDFDGTLEDGEQLRVFFTFEIPEGTLGTDVADRTFVYDSPIGITSSDATKDNPGHFKNIGAQYYFDGDKIYIIFDKDVAEQNAKHPITEGTLYFESDADHIGSGNNGKFDFGNNHEETIKVNHKGDLTVQKSHATPLDDGTVTWTVAVSSVSGTKPNTSISITDVPSLGTIDSSSIHVDGGSCTSTSANNGFNMTCPALGENGTYTITYTSKVNVKDGEVTYQENGVTVKAKDKNDNELNKTASDNVSWDKKPSVSKSNGVLNADGTATWTVTVDATKLDSLEGWKLNDTVNGGKLSGKITVEPAVGGKTEFSSFPIEFTAKDAKATYTFTYTTTPNAGTGPAMVKNTANLIPPNGGQQISTGEKGVDPGTFNPLDKTHGTVTASSDGKTTIVPWTVTIAPKNNVEALPAGWSYTDSLNNQYLDNSQKTAVKSAIETAFAEAELSTPTITFTENDGKVVGFTVTSSDALGIDKVITFSYEATGMITYTWNGEQTYSNTVSTSGFTKSDSVTYSPSNLKWTIKKIDAKTNSESDSTTHEYNDSSSMEQINGQPIMHWQVESDQTEYISDVNAYTDLTIKEQLPEGVSLVEGSGLTFKMVWGFNNPINLTVPAANGSAKTTISGEYGLNGKSFDITVKRSGNVLTIQIPAEMLKTVAQEAESGNNNKGWYKAQLLLDVRVTIDDVSKLSDTAKVFKNTATLSDASGKTWGEKSQSQKITKDDKWDVVKKTSSYNSNSNDNLVPYSIVVNPNGLDLDEDSDTVTLEDDFTYQFQDSSPVEFSLKEVKVYDYDAQTGTKGSELPSSDYTVTPDSTADGDKRTNHLKLTVPDARALVVEYSYKAVGNDGAQVTVSNNVSLNGKTSGVNGVSVKVASSRADALISAVTFTKIDSKNNSKALPNAVFDLYEWDSSKGWVKLCADLKTNSEGQLVFSASATTTGCSANSGETDNTSDAYVRFNKAYMLKETQAPSGYDTPTGDAAKHYFMLYNKEKESQYPVTKPDDFPSGAIHISGYTGFILNDRSPASLPSTGGTGDGWFIGGGLLTVMVASFGLAESLKNAKRSKVSQK